MKHFLWLTLFAATLVSACRQNELSPGPGGGSQLQLSAFQSAQTCSTCHPQQYQEWNASMHRYGSNDPIWMLASNGLHAGTQGRLGTWCFQCHSPMAFLTGTAISPFQISELPAILREGINCDVCHTLRPPYTTTNQNIQYTIRPGRVKYGTISDPVPAGIHDNAYDASYSRSEVCRPCHDLVVNNVPVEMTFTEWQNSPWGAMSRECQDCHMPEYTGQAAIGGPVRQGLHNHEFVGVDVAITDFPNKTRQRAVVDSLLKNSASMSIQMPSVANLPDTIDLQVTVYNDKTGHNLPTSVFFFREMWLEVTAWNGTDTAYRSGNLDANGDLMDRNSALQPNADRDLVLFGGILYKNGVESNVFELDSLVNNSLPPFGSKTSTYRFRANTTGPLSVKVRLLFRPFGPYLFRAVGANQYISEIPTFEMLASQGTIDIQ